MVSSDCKRVPKEIGTTMLDQVHQSQDFFVGCTVVLLCFGKGAAAIGNDPVLAILLLKEHCNNSTVSGIDV